MRYEVCLNTYEVLLIKTRSCLGLLTFTRQLLTGSCSIEHLNNNLLLSAVVCAETSRFCAPSIQFLESTFCLFTVSENCFFMVSENSNFISSPPPCSILHAHVKSWSFGTARSAVLLLTRPIFYQQITVTKFVFDWLLTLASCRFCRSSFFTVLTP